MYESNIAKIRSLRLCGFADFYARIRAMPEYESISHDEFLAMALEAMENEAGLRLFRRLRSRAKLKISDAAMENIDYTVDRGLNRGVIANLATCAWVHKGQHVILTGPAGSGKTHVVSALGNECIRRGTPVRYVRLHCLLEDLMRARADGSIVKLRNDLAKAKLLIIDDFGLSPITNQGVDDLFNIINYATAAFFAVQAYSGVTSRAPSPGGGTKTALASSEGCLS